jgi:hypothetical protein
MHLIHPLKSQVLSNRWIALLLGVSEMAIRKLVGPSTIASQHVLSVASVNPASDPPAVVSLDRPRGHQDQADRGSCVEDEPASMSLDIDPDNRTFDRLQACSGLIDDAAPLFSDTCAVPGGGLLLSVPLLVRSGIFHLARKLYGQIGPTFYGLCTTLPMIILAFITDPSVLRKLLDYLGLPSSDPPRGPSRFVQREEQVEMFEWGREKQSKEEEKASLRQPRDPP